MTRLRGRAYDSAPHGHWCVTSMISSGRLDGTTACMTVDAATDGDAFLVYVQDILVPTLRPGDIVVLDNLSVHKHKDIAPLIKKGGCHRRISSAVFPGLQPDRKDVGQNQGVPARRQSPDCRRTQCRHCGGTPDDFIRRCTLLVCRIRLRCFLNCSSASHHSSNRP